MSPGMSGHELMSHVITMGEPCTRYPVSMHTAYSKLERMGCTLAVWEGPTELLLAKVKNASGRIGIFYITYTSRLQQDAGLTFLASGRAYKLMAFYMS